MDNQRLSHRIYCRFCGVSIPANCRFCPQCGEYLQTEDLTETERSHREESDCTLFKPTRRYSTILPSGHTVKKEYASHHTDRSRSRQKNRYTDMAVHRWLIVMASVAAMIALAAVLISFRPAAETELCSECGEVVDFTVDHFCAHCGKQL